MKVFKAESEYGSLRILFVAVLAALLLFSCDTGGGDGDDTGGPTPGTGDGGGELLLSGTILGLTPDAGGTVRAAVEPEGLGTSFTLATADIGDDGSFSLTLPVPPAGLLEPVEIPFLVTGVDITPVEAELLLLLELEVYGDIGRTGSLIRATGPTGPTVEFWFYVDRATTITGTGTVLEDIDEDGDPEVVRYTFTDFRLNEGWNRTFFTYSFPQDDPLVDAAIDATTVTPSRLNWIYFSD